MRWFHHDTVDSTSERAFAELAAGRAEHFDVHVARAQTAGRGRLGRTWSSPPGAGLYLSAVLLPGPPALSPAALTMAAGLAVRDAVATRVDVEVLLKWPNDVIVQGAKLAGILVESRGLEASAPHYVVGIGLNVGDGEYRADQPLTSLAALGCVDAAEDVARDVVDGLATWVELIRADSERLTRDFAAATGLLGTHVEAGTSKKRVRGRLLGIDLERGLRLETDDGPRDLPLEHVQVVKPA